MLVSALRHVYQYGAGGAYGSGRPYAQWWRPCLKCGVETLDLNRECSKCRAKAYEEALKKKKKKAKAKKKKKKK